MNPPALPDLPAPPPGKHGWPWTEASPPVPASLPDGRPWPRISIVTPSFNQGQFIEETLRSVLLQGYPNLEYVVMDGGSTDGSVDIIRKYAPWLAHWVSQPDRGQSHAINQGFARTTGEIMAWLNSDDLYAPGALAEAARGLAGQGRALLVGAAQFTDASGRACEPADRRRPTWDEMAYSLRTYPQPSVFWMRDLWRASGPLDESLDYVMDRDLWLRMRPKAQRVQYTDVVLSQARSHPGQKGVRAATDRRYVEQRARSSLRAALERGERAWPWVARVWQFEARGRPFRSKLGRWISPGFHWQVLRAAFTSTWTSWARWK